MTVDASLPLSSVTTHLGIGPEFLLLSLTLPFPLFPKFKHQTPGFLFFSCSRSCHHNLLPCSSSLFIFLHLGNLFLASSISARNFKKKKYKLHQITSYLKSSSGFWNLSRLFGQNTDYDLALVFRINLCPCFLLLLVTTHIDFFAPIIQATLSP